MLYFLFLWFIYIYVFFQLFACVRACMCVCARVRACEVNYLKCFLIYNMWALNQLCQLRLLSSVWNPELQLKHKMNCSSCNKTGSPVQTEHLLLNTFLYKSHKVSQSSSIRRNHNRSVRGKWCRPERKVFW